MLSPPKTEEEPIARPRIGGLHASSVEAVLNGAMSGVGFERVSTTQCRGFEIVEMRVHSRERGGKNDFVHEMGYAPPMP